jgi:transposase
MPFAREFVPHWNQARDERFIRVSSSITGLCSSLVEAITYSLNCWSGLTRFLGDGRLCMSNNAAERALRCVAVGRRNWTFAGSGDGGRRAAAIYTLIETALCRARHSAVYAEFRTMPSAFSFARSDAEPLPSHSA